VKACISHQQVPSGWTEHPDLIDHRYFYRRDNDIGGNTCGLIRDAITDQLLMWGVDFADTDFLTSLRMFTTNPSITGFMIESAVLSSIRSHGLAIGAKIKRPMKMRLFTDLFNIATDIINEPVLYYPKRFNHLAIDGIIVLIEPNKPIEEKHPKKYEWNTKKNTKDNAEDNKEDEEEEQEKDGEEDEEDEEDEKDKDFKKGKKRLKLRIFPLQIALALSDHKDSYAQFFDHYYDKWAKGLSDFDVESQFLWITPDRRSTKKHKVCDKWPQHIERFIHFEDVNATIWRKYQEATGDTGRGTTRPSRLLDRVGQHHSR
jgi:hypothetical protein